MAASNSGKKRRDWDKDFARGNWENGNNPNVFLISVNLFSLWISHLFAESLAITRALDGFDQG